MCVKIMRLSMGTGGSRYRAGRRRQRRARGMCEKRQMRDATCMRFECGSYRRCTVPDREAWQAFVVSRTPRSPALDSKRNWHEH
jgi:hypothetical protein